jgi:cytochrome c biogenesis protein CcdA
MQERKMERQGEEVHVKTNEARGGATPHIVRYVLGFSLILAILALSAIWIIGATYREKHENTNALTTEASPAASPSPTQS